MITRKSLGTRLREAMEILGLDYRTYIKDGQLRYEVEGSSYTPGELMDQLQRGWELRKEKS